jgi:hypothetical protein
VIGRQHLFLQAEGTEEGSAAAVGTGDGHGLAGGHHAERLRAFVAEWDGEGLGDRSLGRKTKKRGERKALEHV